MPGYDVVHAMNIPALHLLACCAAGGAVVLLVGLRLAMLHSSAVTLRIM